ncbi:MAG: hypothetical protein HUJ54_03565 [Erysipelotrichaceae bacterium]|nr:hypothetical protein [Erysipelotrichaceae bacterium]
MGLSKETIHFYISNTAAPGSSSSVFGLLAVSDFDRKQLRQKLESVKKQTWKGSRLTAIDICQVSSGNDKLFKDLIQSVFSFRRTGLFFMTFASTSSRKESELFSALLEEAKNGYPGCLYTAVTDDSVRKAISTKALKKAGVASLSKEEMQMDEDLQQTAAFLTGLAAGQADTKPVGDLLGLLQRQLIGNTRKTISGDLLNVQKALKGDALKASEKILEQEPDAAALIDFWLRKKAGPAVYQNALMLLDQGTDLKTLSSLPLTRLSEDFEVLAAQYGPKGSRPFDEAWEEALRRLWINGCQSFDALPNGQFDQMKAEVEEMIRSSWNEIKTGSQKGRISIFQDSEGWKVFVTENVSRVLKADWTDSQTLLRNADFFKENVHIFSFESADSQFEQLCRMILHQKNRYWIHAGSSLLSLMRRRIISRNEMGSLFALDEGDEIIQQTADRLNLMPARMEADFGEPELHQWILLKEGFEKLSDRDFYLLSDPDISLAFLPRLARALSMGLDAEKLMECEKPLDREDWQWYLRKQAQPYLYTTKKQRFLKAVSEKMTLEQYDLISNPAWSLSQMELLADALSGGLDAERIHQSVHQGMTLTRMREALQQAEETDPMPSGRILLFMNDRELKKALEEQYEKLPETLNWMNASIKTDEVIGKLVNYLENETKLLSVLSNYRSS